MVAIAPFSMEVTPREISRSGYCQWPWAGKYRAGE